jgi:4-amino-4-deoxy-L-arabinose transferase
MRSSFLPFSKPAISELKIQAVAAVLRSGWITTGPKAAEFGFVNRMVQQATGVMMHDYGCMLRTYRHPVVDAILQCRERSTFIPILANSFAGSTAEIPMRHALRENGESKYSFLKLISLQFDLLTSMSTFPLRLLSFMGVVISTCWANISAESTMMSGAGPAFLSRKSVAQHDLMNKLNIIKAINIKKGYAALLLAFFLLSYILPLGARDLVVPDETRYAEIPREMIAGGDWVVPHLNGLRYFEKPALGYWVHAGSILLFGENNFAVRLPSALAVGLSALLIYVLVRRVSHGEDEYDGFPAVLATLIFLSCFEVFGVGNTAVLDSLFSFFLTASITAFYFASEEQPGSGREKGFLLLAGLSCGLAFMTKGFLAFAVPVLGVVPYLVWQRRYSDLFRMSWLPILVAVLAALPWSIAIHLREPDFWRFFFWNEHIRRFMADNAQHKESFWFFFLTAPGMFVPWLFMVPAAVPGIKAQLFQRGAQGRLLRLCLCWLALPFLFFSFSNGKLFTYILPCFPPFAVLMAFGLSHVLKENAHNRLFQRGTLVSAVISGLILLAFLYVQFYGFNGFRPYAHPWKVMMVVNGLLFFILFSFWASRSQRWKDRALLFGMAPLLLFFVGHYTIPDLTIESKSPGLLLEGHKQDIADGDVIISDENSIRAVCWYFQRSDVFLIEGAGELDYGLSYKDAAGGRLLNIRSAVDLINRNRGKTVLIARVKNISRWRNQLPKPTFQDDSGAKGYVYWRF